MSKKAVLGRGYCGSSYEKYSKFGAEIAIPFDTHQSVICKDSPSALTRLSISDGVAMKGGAN